MFFIFVFFVSDDDKKQGGKADDEVSVMTMNTQITDFNLERNSHVFGGPKDLSKRLATEIYNCFPSLK